MKRAAAIFPKHFWMGLVLMSVGWLLNWRLDGLRTHLLFFPLWLGFCLTVDGLCFYRSGSSLLMRSWRRYVGMFCISAPVWWLFELLNRRTHNWLYLGRDAFTAAEYALFATINFSTVVPAVFSTAELWWSFRFMQRRKPWGKVPITPQKLRLYVIIGGLMLALILAAPRYGYPLLWSSLVFILEPINFRIGARSLLDDLRGGDWRKVWSLWLGGLTCGFFWELWNWRSYPKWVYHTPFVQFAHVFDMPLLGYLGYLPFAMELFALYHLAVFLVGSKNNYLFSEPE